MKQLLLSMILTLYATLIFSQNYLFEEGNSGFHIGGQIESTDGSELFGIIPGYTSNGRLSLSLAIGYENNDDLDLSSTSIKPNISYLVLKQGENDQPISLALGGGYQYNTFSDFDDLTANIISIGAEVYHQVETSSSMQIIPSFMLSWAKTTLNFNGFSEDESAISYGISATALFTNFYIRPILAFSEGNSRFGLTLGLIFPN